MVHWQPDLRSKPNPACCTCTGEERKQKLDEGLCPDVASTLDGNPVRCVGSWAYDKIYFLLQYFGIFSQGMKNKFPGKLTYVEICCGPGRCIRREDREEIDGTSLAIVNHPNLDLLSSAIFLDRNPRAIDILNDRIQKIGQQHRASARVADYNDAAKLISMLTDVPRDGLNLVFIDPTDCSVPFATVRAIVEALGRVDLIITCPIGMDFNRNAVDAVLLPDSFAVARSKYSGFLGSDAFFLDPAVIGMARREDHGNLCVKFRNYYHAAFEQIGFRFFDHRRVRHYYDVMFASRHELGLTFWREAQRYGPDNQKSLDLWR